jgi:hypothetical protein
MDWRIRIRLEELRGEAGIIDTILFRKVQPLSGHKVRVSSNNPWLAPALCRGDCAVGMIGQVIWYETRQLLRGA